jgi:acyl carrier protein
MGGRFGAQLSELAARAERDVVTIESWLTARVAALIRQSTAEIDVTRPFSTYALDSVDTVGLTADLEDWLGINLDPTLIWDYPSIRALARHLVSVEARS